ncbi:MAG: SRPBCC domain-containing protein [Candidatus Aquilonibacter sp.]
MNNSTTAPTMLIMKHTFNASPERVYKAWTDPQILREFMCVSGNARVDAATDVRVGGSFRIVMFRDDGEQFIATGTYRELAPNERIVCTWSWEEDDPALARETILTLEFAPRGTQTELTLTHENFRDAQQRDNHAKGWGAMLAELERVL